MNPITEYHLDHIELRVEPDLIFVRPHGSLAAQQVGQLGSLITQLQGPRLGRLFLLVDLHESVSLSPALRRAMSQTMADFQPTAMAVYGANGEQRGTHALLMGAVTAVAGRRPNAAYFATEAEAREWLAAERQRLLGP